MSARAPAPHRSAYLRYDELTALLHDWQERHPDRLRLESLGKTPEGREIWLASAGAPGNEPRPTVMVSANLHANELCGSNVALGILEEALGLFGAGAAAAETDAFSDAAGSPLHETLRGVRLAVIPRISPDGAEAVLTSGRWIRSVPRDQRAARGARWVARDVDGDGSCQLLRVRDEAGQFVESARFAGLMVPRLIDDPGPYYQLYPEGIIDGFDGVRVPSPGLYDDQYPDLNRNFPFSWAPEGEQIGAGRFATSEPEVRAVVEYATRHPELFAWIDLHSFGGVVIRPLGHAPDAKMDPADLALYRQLEAWVESETGYPTVSGYKEFTYEADKPLHGDLVDFAYHQLGCFAYTVELWDLFAELGLARPERFVDHYSRLGREELERLYQWDRDQNDGRVFRSWRACEHPQLGPVDVGGMDPRVGIWNPPESRLGELCAKHARLALQVAMTAPRLRIRVARIERLSDDRSLVNVVVENLGYLPSYGLYSARELPGARRVQVRVECEGPVLESPRGTIELEPLSGWGRGRYNDSFMLPRSHGEQRRGLSAVLRGRGEVTFVAEVPKAGRASCKLTLDADRVARPPGEQ